MKSLLELDLLDTLVYSQRSSVRKLFRLGPSVLLILSTNWQPVGVPEASASGDPCCWQTLHVKEFGGVLRAAAAVGPVLHTPAHRWIYVSV